jgi:SulP family sulfate permease
MPEPRSDPAVPQGHPKSTLWDVLCPFCTWPKSYRLSYVRGDLIAGLTVAVVLIPQAMAYAMLAGLPPVYGLYAAAVTPAIAAMWGSLRQLATGPIAIMSLLVLTTLSGRAEPGSPAFIEQALLLAVMVGVIYLAIGLFRLGILMAFISHSAVKGFTSAAAIIICTTQLPNLLGLTTSRHEFIFPMLVDIVKNLPNFTVATTILGLGAFAVIHGMKTVKPNFPAGLLALVLTTAAVAYFQLDRLNVAIIGQVPAGLAGFKLPHFSFKTISELTGPAIVLALVSFAETYSVGKAIASKTKQKVDVDQEFIGQGMANLVGAFFQSYPVSGSFSRTAISYSSGAKTGAASIVSSLSVILALLFLTPLLTTIPKAALAALVISAVLSLFNPKELISLWKMNRHDGIVALTVFVLALLTKPDYALLIGVIISLVFFLWKTMHPRIVRVTKDPDHNMFCNGDALGKPSCPQILQLRSDNALYFANAEYTFETIRQRLYTTDTAPLKYLLLDFEAIGFVDLTGIDEMRELASEVKSRGIALALMCVRRPVREALQRAGFIDELLPGHLIENRNEVIGFLFPRIDHDYCMRTCPHELFYECRSVK